MLAEAAAHLLSVGPHLGISDLLGWYRTEPEGSGRLPSGYLLARGQGVQLFPDSQQAYIIERCLNDQQTVTECPGRLGRLPRRMSHDL